MAAAGGGDQPLCGRHLAYDWRMYTTYPDGESVVIVALDRHTDEHNPAAQLAAMAPGARDGRATI